MIFDLDQDEMQEYAVFIASMNLVMILVAVAGIALGQLRLALTGVLFVALIWPINVLYITAYVLSGSMGLPEMSRQPGENMEAEQDIEDMAETVSELMGSMTEGDTPGPEQEETHGDSKEEDN